MLLLITFLIFVSTITPILTSASLPVSVSDYATCHEIESQSPINRDFTYLTSDSNIYCWIALRDVVSGNHTVVWRWYFPNGTCYYENSYAIPESSNGTGWSAYNVWANIKINGFPPSAALGTWSVSAYLDEAYLFSKDFVVAESRNFSYINNVKFFYQQNSSWCGPAALQMVLNYFGVYKSQDEIAQAVWSIDAQTTYIASMQKYAQQLGFVSQCKSGSIDILKQNIDSGIPAIVLQNASERVSLGHYRVVVGYDDHAGVFITLDPSIRLSPNYNLTYSQFVSLWQYSNTTLIIQPSFLSPTPQPITATPLPIIPTPLPMTPTPEPNVTNAPEKTLPPSVTLTPPANPPTEYGDYSVELIVIIAVTILILAVIMIIRTQR